ncbi:hypothetical protein DFQ27_005221 [Actinomortierella ambigua]|uniref:Uncharacterized protein n=1 Tax=Actinomortierella ambigua TaxID=1343610 RepID=A0A9P6QHR4_9FUNG|nr:hypothetical protein DFQ27_005221 [Actinomortierella ambigua]
MLFTRAFLQSILLAVVLLVVIVQAAPRRGCYRLCRDDGMSKSECEKQCLDKNCYRECLQMGETNKYCKDACMD